MKNVFLSISKFVASLNKTLKLVPSAEEKIKHERHRLMMQHKLAHMSRKRKKQWIKDNEMDWD